MITRREINSKHEAAVIAATIIAHNERMGTIFSIESRPDPPDAILFDGHQRTWLEHTDAFYPGWAEDLTSYAASDKKHRPMRKGPHMDMDNHVANAFVDVVLKKFNNESYKPIVEQLGPGILVVGIESPWLDEETLQAINSKWAELDNLDLSSVFLSIYLGFRDNGKNKAIPWNGSS